MMTCSIARQVLTFGSTMLLCGLLATPSLAATEVIQVQFDTSCNAAVPTEFNEAVTPLHSFEYGETTRRFNEIN